VDYELEGAGGGGVKLERNGERQNNEYCHITREYNLLYPSLWYLALLQVSLRSGVNYIVSKWQFHYLHVMALLN
jgi:hypothetical protein